MSKNKKLKRLFILMTATAMLPQTITSVYAVTPVVQEQKVVKTPADVIDFSTWKLQMPIAKEEGSTSIKEISSEELVAGYDDGQYMYLDEDGSVVFSSPVAGFKTANTSYTRSELREMLDGKSKTSNWGFKGTHELKTSQSVSAIPSNGRVVTSQIHSIWPNGDNGPALVKVEYDGANEQVVVMYKSSTAPNAADVRFYFEDVKLNQRFDTEIKIVDGVVYTTITSEGRSESFTYDFMGIDPNWDTYLNYFKAGSYVQDSVADYEGEVGTVKIYELTTFHDDNYVEDIAIKSLGLEGDAIELGLGEVAPLKAVFTPIDTLNKALAYKVVSGADVAAVNKEGVVTAIKEGTAVVEVTSVDDPSVKTQCNITVADKPAQEVKPIYTQNFGIDKAVDLAEEGFKTSLGGTTDVSVKQEADNFVLSVTDTDAAGSGKFLAFFPEQTETTTVSYKIRLDEVAVKDAGGSKAQGSYLYAPIGGSDEFLASADETFRLRNASTYQAGEVKDHRWVLTHGYKTPEINPEAANVNVGEWAEVTLVSTPNNGTATANTTDVYINGIKVADKMVNNKATDTLNIVQFYSGTKDLVNFSVDDIEVYSGAKAPASTNSALPTEVKVAPAAGTLAIGDSVELEAAAYPVGAQEALTYTVQTPGILAVSNEGLVTAVAEGNGVVRVASKNAPDVYTDYILNVVEPSAMVRVESVEVAKESTSTPVDQALDLGVVVSPEAATEKGVKYEVLKGADAATIDANGVLNPLAIGEVVVRVSSLENPDIFTDCTVKIISNKPVGTIVYEQNFDEKLDDKWTTATANINNTENVVKDGAFYFKDNSTGGQPKAYLTFEPQADMFTIQFKFKLDADPIYKDTKVSALSSAFGTGSITSSANEAFRFKTAGTVAEGVVTNRQFTNSNETGSLVRIPDSSIELGKWYTISLTTTPDNGTPNANTTDVYIDGVKMIDGVGNKKAMPIIDKFIFQTGTADLTEYWVDDFKIWTGDYTDYKAE